MQCEKVRKCPKSKTVGHVRGAKRKELMARFGILSNKVNNVVLSYNPKYKINIHKCILIQIYNLINL